MQELMDGVFLLSLPHLPFSPSPAAFLPFLPLRRMVPLNQLGVWRSAVSSPSGVQGGAPAENEFDAL